MDTICPECQEKNSLTVEGDQLVCGHCKKKVAHIKNLNQAKVKKPLISTAVAIFLGVGGSQMAIHYYESHRYPLRVEYSELDQCVNLYGRSIPKEIYKIQKNMCLCALEQTQKEVSYLDYKLDSENDFHKKFYENALDCVTNE